MRRFVALVATAGFVASAFAGPKPLATVAKYDGKFQWVKLSELPADSLKSLGKAQSILVEVSFPKDVKLKKDARGNVWFTFILADQGSDWKWNQTKGFGSLPAGG